MEEEWLCREMERLFGADPDGRRVGSKTDPDWHSGCVVSGRNPAARASVESAGGRGAGSTLVGVPGTMYEAGQTGTCPTPVPQAHLHPKYRYQSQTDARQTETDGELTSPLQLGRSPDSDYRLAAECQRPERPLLGRREYLTGGRRQYQTGRGEYQTGRREYQTGGRCCSPLSTGTDISSSSSPAAQQYLCRSAEALPVRPTMFRFPPVVPATLRPSSESAVSLPLPLHNWAYPENVTPLLSQSQSPASVGQSQSQSPASVGTPTRTSLNSDFSPLFPLSVPSRFSSRSPPSPLSPRLPPSPLCPRLPARPRCGSAAARRPGPPLHPLPPLPGSAAGGGSALLGRRKWRHRSRTHSAGGSAAPKCSGKQTCVFCRKNGESKEVVTSHCLRDSSGRVLCPMLRSHVCELCQLTGDYAHTRTYCPLAADGGRPGPSTTVQLKSTRNNATGRRRH